MLFTLLAGFCLVMAFIGCSDDPAPTGGTVAGDTTALELLSLGDLVAAVAPPEFSAAVAKPLADSFEVWTEGESSLLNKVFGTDDPQTLYRNIESYEMYMEIAEHFLFVDENGDIVTGTFEGTHTDTIDGQEVTETATAVITALPTATTIPSEGQSVIGISVDVDYLISVSVDEISGGTFMFGVKCDSTEQTVLAYEADMSGLPNHDESSLVYASMDPRDSTFTFRGVGYSEDDRGVFNYVFNITSDADADFSYRMSWYSDDASTETTLLGSIIGGGNKDTEFGMTYRQFTPADDDTPDPEWAFEEVFGPDYTNGTGLITDYSTYTDTTNYYNYDDVPNGDITNPFVQ